MNESDSWWRGWIFHGELIFYTSIVSGKIIKHFKVDNSIKINAEAKHFIVVQLRIKKLSPKEDSHARKCFRFSKADNCVPC